MDVCFREGIVPFEFRIPFQFIQDIVYKIIVEYKKCTSIQDFSEFVAVSFKCLMSGIFFADLK